MSCWSGGLRDSNVNAGFHQSIQDRWGDLTAADSTHLDWKILGNQARIELQASSLLDKVRKVKSVMKVAREEWYPRSNPAVTQMNYHTNLQARCVHWHNSIMTAMWVTKEWSWIWGPHDSNEFITSTVNDEKSKGPSLVNLIGHQVLNIFVYTFSQPRSEKFLFAMNGGGSRSSWLAIQVQRKRDSWVFSLK